MHCESEKGIRGTHTHTAQSERANMWLFELLHANVVLLFLLLLVLLFFRGFIIVCVDLATARM